MKLLLPLKYYDEAGRVLPPVALYVCLFFLCRSVLVFLASALVKEYSHELLSFFYPEKIYLYINLVIALPALVSIAIVTFREKIWISQKGWLFRLIKPLTIFSVLADLAFNLFLADLSHWQFSWVIAMNLLFCGLCLYFIVKDKHLKLMLADWRLVVSQDSTST